MYYRLFSVHSSFRSCYQPRGEGGIVFSSVCLFVSVSVNAITPEPLEVSSRNFQTIILWSKGRTSSKIAIHPGACGWWFNVSGVLILTGRCGQVASAYRRWARSPRTTRWWKLAESSTCSACLTTTGWLTATTGTSTSPSRPSSARCTPALARETAVPATAPRSTICRDSARIEWTMCWCWTSITPSQPTPVSTSVRSRRSTT